MTTDKKHLATLADLFLAAADFPLHASPDKLGAYVEPRLDLAEKKIVEDEIFNALAKKRARKDDIGHEALALANVFCQAATRLGVQEQAALLIPAKQIGRKTEKELRNAGLPHLANMVSVARRVQGL